RSFPQAHGPAHPVFDPLGVLAGVFLGMMAYKDRLPQRDPVGDGVHGGAGSLGLGATLVAVLLEALGPVLGAVDQGSILVVNLPAQLAGEVFTLRRPGRSDE